MKELPPTADVLLLRTDFSDQGVWEAVCAAVKALIPSDDLLASLLGHEGFRAEVECVSDPAYASVSPDQIVQLAAEAYSHGFIFLVDEETVTSPERPILVLSLDEEPGRTFRAPPDQIQGIENNLSLANMDFFEFADNVDEDGVFRGFGDR